MSNPLAAIGKAFKAVVKVVKKIALPVLAIGAVVLTGGAALGILPALGGAGGLLASVGITGTLAGVITSAANAAMFGAVGAALTGGNIVKGASLGLLTGGVLGAVGLGIPGPAAGKAVEAGAQGLAQVAQGATETVSGLPPVSAGASFADAFAPIANGAGSSVATGASAVGGLAQSLSAPVVSSIAPVATAAVPTSAGGLGGLGGFIQSNPVLVGSAINGLGAGLSAKAQADQRAAEQQQIRDNYSDTSGLFRLSDQQPNAQQPNAADYYDTQIYGAPKRLVYNQSTGRVVAGA